MNEIDGRAVERALARAGGVWREVRVVAETGSTNADLTARARLGAAEGSVLVAEAQTAGRGRLGRSWVAPARSGLMFSVLLRPEVPLARHGWLPLLTGVAVATAVRDQTGVAAQLKWPNDVLVGDRKLAGILVERVADALVAGVGLNVSLREDELPVPSATSLELEGATRVSREALLGAILTELEDRYRRWVQQEGDPVASGLRDSYAGRCATLGRDVRVELPAGDPLVGRASGIGESGALLVSTPAGIRTVSAGDVIHVR